MQTKWLTPTTHALCVVNKSADIKVQLAIKINGDMTCSTCYFSAVCEFYDQITCTYCICVCCVCAFVCQRGTTSLVECLTVMRHQGILHDLDHIVEVAYHLVVSRRTGPAPPENRWNTLHHNAQRCPCPASPSTTLVLWKVYTRVLA